MALPLPTDPHVIEGLKRHNLPTDRPSQLSDAFRLGMAYAALLQSVGQQKPLERVSADAPPFPGGDWKIPVFLKPREPSRCGKCDYDEAEGELLEQCEECKAADKEFQNGR
jgi:hypothetical protein